MQKHNNEYISRVEVAPAWYLGYPGFKFRPTKSML